MELQLRPLDHFLSPAIKSLRPSRMEFSQFNDAITTYLSRINENETEENHKTHLMDVFKTTFPSGCIVEPHGRIDFVIRSEDQGSRPAVLVETKASSNKAEMIRVDDVNRKALHEAMLYYMRERVSGNISITHVIICSTFEFFVFEAQQFERNFYGNASLLRAYQDWVAGRTPDAKNDFFYSQIAAPFIDSSTAELECVRFDLRETAEPARLKVYKILSAQNLLREAVPNDSNTLDMGFYDELLYIIGLEEIKKGSKKRLMRKERGRQTGSLMELCLADLSHSDELNKERIILRYGLPKEQRAYAIALELCLTWINRLLFLKLLEAQLVRFHGDEEGLEFLNGDMIGDFADLSNLFFLVLAQRLDDRPELVARYERIPYLNSSLFERTPLERVLNISALSNVGTIEIFGKTVLRDNSGRKATGELNTLPYLLRFLDAYDFGSVAGGEIRENSKNLINSSVLGLIFEKINGHEDGAVFTPGIITMNMSRRAIEAAAIDAFIKRFPKGNISSIADISNNIMDRSAEELLRLNEIIDGLKICDPAVGSGHFLVSCLNELIALKSRLGILADADGRRVVDYIVDVDNDELVVLSATTGAVFSYRVGPDGVPAELQRMQVILFEQKRKLIENCLFGVDINRNSVRICQLRLWIELLKNSYYRDDGELETLPNIDINIKVGDSLLSRYPLDQSLSSAFKSAGLSVRDYREMVDGYKLSRDRSAKRALEQRISVVKNQFQSENLGKLERAISSELSELRNREAQLSLLDPSGDEDARTSHELEKARANIRRLEAKLATEVRLRSYAGALEWRFEFPEILSSDGAFVGFDIVLGNPPYGVAVRDDRREIITRIVGKVPDYEIYYMFLQQARRLLKPGGYLSFIVPNTMLSNVNARSYRLNLLSEWEAIQIDDLTEYRVFSDAVVHNIIVTARRGPAGSEILFRKTGGGLAMAEYLEQSQKSVTPEQLRLQNRNWGLVFRLDTETSELISRIAAYGLPLKDVFDEVSQGLIAYDKHQGQDAATIANRVFHKKEPSSLTSPWLNGADVRPFSVVWNGEDYLEYGEHLANPRKSKYFTRPRVLVREITNPGIYAGFTEREAYNDPAIINILAAGNATFPLKALEAILNSKMMTFYHFNSSPKATKGAFPKVLVADIREMPLPIPEVNSDVLRDLADMADLIRRCIVSGDADELEIQTANLNSKVYALYGLSTADINLVNKMLG